MYFLRNTNDIQWRLIPSICLPNPQMRFFSWSISKTRRSEEFGISHINVTKKSVSPWIFIFVRDKNSGGTKTSCSSFTWWFYIVEALNFIEMHFEKQNSIFKFSVVGFFILSRKLEKKILKISKFKYTPFTYIRSFNGLQIEKSYACLNTLRLEPRTV